MDHVSSAVSGIAHESSFVTVSGLEFSLSGKPFYFQGTNFRHAGLLEGARSDREIYDAFAELGARGISVARMWAFSCGDQIGGTPMIADIIGGEVRYNEDALRRLDLTLDAARTAQMKVILTLVNFEPSYCGMDWWVKALTGDVDKQRFYTDPTIKEAFKAHISNLLDRVNTRYARERGENIAYKDDPTILALEPANEPHTEDAYERDRGLPPGQIVNTWLREMTDHIRSRDPNHLITTGEEGYKIAHTWGDDRGRHAWIHDGLKGVDFAGNLTLPSVDFTTLHLYPDNWEIPSSEMWWVRDYIVQDRADIAHNVGKPIILEESGFDASTRFALRGYSVDVAGYLRQVFKLANHAGYAGTMVWQALPVGFGSVSGYDFDPNAPQFQVVEDQARCLESLNQGTDDCAAIDAAPDPVAPACSDEPPDSRYTCGQQAAWGHCDQSWMTGFCNATCGRCSSSEISTCTDVAPDTTHTCAEQSAWGKCSETWMAGFCNAACGRCTTSPRSPKSPSKT